MFMKDILSTRPNFIPDRRPEIKSEGTSLAFETIDEAKDIPCNSEPMFLDELHDFLEGSLTRELPYNVPFPAKAKLIKQSMAEWHYYCLKCFNDVKDDLRTHLLALVRKHYERYTRGGLEDHVRRIIEIEIDRCDLATKDRIKWLLELEDPPFTKNDHYFASYRENYLAQYKESRRQSGPLPVPASFNFARKGELAFMPERTRQDEVNEVLAGLSRLGHTGKKEGDLARLNDSDPFEQELIVMAEVSAYFRIAYKRIIDNLPRVIDHDFLRALDQNIHGALNKGLGVGESDAYARAENFLKDEPDVVAAREELSRKKERLEEIVERLDRFYV